MNDFQLGLEKSVLGMLLKWGGNELKDKAELVRACDFSSPIIRELFERAKSASFDIALLSAAEGLDRERLLIAATALDGACFISHFDGEFAEVKRHSEAERLKEALNGLMFSEDLSVEKLRAVVEKEEQNVSVGEVTNATREAVTAYKAALGKPKSKILSGIGAIDNVVGGFLLPSVCIVGARPSTGKTAFALNVALNARARVAIFSLEMSTAMLIDRMASRAYSIRYEKFLDGTLSESELALVRKFADWVADKMTVIDSVYTIEEMAAAVRRVKPRLVIIDYAQIIRTVKVFKNVREQISYISGEVKRIAKDNDCCVMLLSQLSRDGRDAPTMSALKESGSLEADGDYILLLHRPYVIDKANPSYNPMQMQVIIDKNKFGKTGCINLSFLGEFQKITSVEEHRNE